MSSKSLQLVTGFLMAMVSMMAAIQSFALPPLPPVPITNANWIGMGPNTNGAVYALACYSDEIYAGGDFTEIGGESANNIAKWNGSVWSPLGPGMDGGVKALAVNPVTGDLYAGGWFISAGGTPANCVAKWDRGTSTWSALGTGMDGAFDVVNALAIDPANGNVYAGGLFTAADGVTVNNIAKYNVGTSTWSALGAGMDDEVYALAFDAAGNALYAGGWFVNAGAVSANNIAKYAVVSSTWSPLDLGVDGPVNVLACNSSGDLYAGGSFITASGITVNNIAKWDGSWTSLGSGMDKEVNALAFDSSESLYAGGQFTTADRLPAKNIAKWDGINWSALGSGTNYSVRSIVFDSSDMLYAGGNFTIAGGKASKYIAKCAIAKVTVPGAPTAIVATPGNGQVDLNFLAPVNDGGSDITIYTATSTPSGKVGTATKSPITVLGLKNGTSYTFKVTATNAIGTGLASVASAAVKPVSVPSSPLNVKATSGIEKATVSFSAPLSNGGSVITSYTVTSVTPTIGDIRVTRSGSGATPIILLGLRPGTSYSFVVTATNALGSSVPSAISNAVIPTATVPGAPTGVIAMRDDTQVFLNFHPPMSNGGSAITGYSVYSGGKLVGASNSRPMTIVGLINGKAYTFTVKATNDIGQGPASLASKAVTPAAPLTDIGAIIGTVAAGQVLTAGDLTPGGATAVYQWTICDTVGGTYTDIAGAKAKTYKLVVGNTSKFIKVEATGTIAYCETVISAATVAVAAPITAISAITGTAKVGSVLTAGKLTPIGATASYQWKIAATSGGAYADIAGATTNKYTPVAGDVNKFIKVVVTGLGGYTGTLTSKATAAVVSSKVLGPVGLGTAGNFVILAKTAVSTTGNTAVLGDIGLSPAAASFITGFGLIADQSNEFSTSSLVVGNIYAANYTPPTPAKMTTAVSDMETAYTDAAGRTLPDYTELYAGDVTGQTLTPGLYKWGTGVLVSAGGVTISGSATDVWIFQIAQNLTVANGAIVTLSGGAKASNIFWQVAGQTTIGTTAQMKGIILCQTQIAMNTGATLDGRALAQTAVTLIANNVNNPVPVSTVATVTSAAYTVNAVAKTITNVPSGVTKAVFLGLLTKGQVNQTWDTTGISATVITGDKLVVMAQDKTTVVTYTVTVNN